MDYELTYIINPNFTEEQISGLKEKIKSFIIEKEGNIKTEKQEIKKKLAYRIQKFDYGYYATIDFAMEPEKLTEFEKKIKFVSLREISQGEKNSVLRYLIIKKGKEAEMTPALLVKSKEKPPRQISGQVKEKVKIEELDKRLEELLKE